MYSLAIYTMHTERQRQSKLNFTTVYNK